MFWKHTFLLPQKSLFYLCSMVNAAAAANINSTLFYGPNKVNSQKGVRNDSKSPELKFLLLTIAVDLN